MHRSPSLSRRTLIRTASAVPLLALPGVLGAEEPDVSDLSDITRDALPISQPERLAPHARAQTLLKAAGIGAVLIEPGS